MQAKTTHDTAVDEVVDWRRRQLVDAGFAPPLAAEIAADSRFDLHALIVLVENSCPPDLAARIMAPLEGKTAA